MAGQQPNSHDTVAHKDGIHIGSVISQRGGRPSLQAFAVCLRLSFAKLCAQSFEMRMYRLMNCQRVCVSGSQSVSSRNDERVHASPQLAAKMCEFVVGLYPADFTGSGVAKTEGSSSAVAEKLAGFENTPQPNDKGSVSPVVEQDEVAAAVSLVCVDSWSKNRVCISTATKRKDLIQRLAEGVTYMSTQLQYGSINLKADNEGTMTKLKNVTQKQRSSLGLGTVLQDAVSGRKETNGMAERAIQTIRRLALTPLRGVEENAGILVAQMGI